jgi:phospholipid N-methyltransferase
MGVYKMKTIDKMSKKELLKYIEKNENYEFVLKFEMQKQHRVESELFKLENELREFGNVELANKLLKIRWIY